MHTTSAPEGHAAVARGLHIGHRYRGRQISPRLFGIHASADRTTGALSVIVWQAHGAGVVGGRKVAGYLRICAWTSKMTSSGLPQLIPFRRCSQLAWQTANVGVASEPFPRHAHPQETTLDG